MKKIILASNNKHKIKEFNEMLADYEILSLEDIGFTDDIVEDGSSFSDNALIKCKEVYKYCKENNYNHLIISDDSGLCCDALDGKPGIFSARYSLNHDDKANRDKLRSDLKGKDKTAHFVCVICLLKNLDEYEFFEGKSNGKIIDEERGNTSFGYDSIFYSTELNKTFGEATASEKNSVSHRSRALEKLKNVL